MAATKEGNAEAPPPPSPVFVVILGALLYFYEIKVSTVVFSAAFPLYLYLANWLCFEKNEPAIAANKGGGRLLCDQSPEKSAAFIQKYIPVFAISGVLLPLVMMCLDFQSDATKCAVPHLFSLVAQIGCEHGSSYLQVHAYIKCLVPIGFSIYRQTLLHEWVMNAFTNYTDEATWQAKFGLALALLNAVIWTYNTFVFLLLRMMPVYLDHERFPVAPVDWKYAGLIPVCKAKQ